MRRTLLLSAVLALALLLPAGAFCVPDGGPAGHVAYVLESGEYRIESGDVGQRVVMEGFGSRMSPGKPMLPEKKILIALPPGARVQSIEVEGIGVTALPGTYQIAPAPPMIPLAEPRHRRELTAKMLREWRRNYEAAYSTDNIFPHEIARLTGTGSLRKYAYAAVSICPISYHPLSGRLTHYDAVRVTVHYELPAPGTAEALEVETLLWDELADGRAAELFVNFDQIKDFYQPAQSSPKAPTVTYDYVIITTSALLSAVTSSDFPTWKASMGYSVRTVLTTDSEITSQSGADLPERIRNFLRSYYVPWGIQWVLMVGDYATVPMRYCYPDPTDHTHNPSNVGNPGGSVPTDYYYADLSLPDATSWDSDGDGYPGEYLQDNPDFLAEVYVGRVPTNDTSRITYTLNKLVSYEEDDGAWKSQALQPGSILFYENQDHDPDMPTIDGSTLLNEIQNDFMTGWTVSRYTEQDGLDPSDFPWPAVSEAAFSDDWRTGQYGIVNWSGHGAPYGVGRTVWEWDDGDGVPETDGSDVMSNPWLINIWSNLDDDYPSIVFAVSCNVGWPEPNGQGNMGIDLLTEPGYGASSGIASSSRPAWISSDFITYPGGAESICYEFNRYGIQLDEPGGQALYDAKYYCNQNYAWDHYAEHINLFNYDWYGDPSMMRTGALTAVESENPGVTFSSSLSLRNQPNPFNPATEISYVIHSNCRVKLEIFNTLGRKIAVLVDERQIAGRKRVRWDARDAAGTELASGIYLCRLHAGDCLETGKMVLMK